MASEIKYIGNPINLKRLRTFILDSDLPEDTVIFLHPHNFDNIVIEYRLIYSEGITAPIRIIDYEIKEDRSNKVPINGIRITKPK